ncbi:hypothetical protein HMPREF1548_02612, partial [Clostridium sp. KLE 1755]
MILAHNPGQVIIHLRQDCAPSGKAVIVAKYRLVEANGLPGKPFVGMVVHIDTEQKIQIVAMVETDAFFFFAMAPSPAFFANTEINIDTEGKPDFHIGGQHPGADPGNILRFPLFSDAVMRMVDGYQLIHGDILRPKHGIGPFDFLRRNGIRRYFLRGFEKFGIRQALFHRYQQGDKLAAA